MLNQIEVFPFMLTKRFARPIFNEWKAENREMLHREYGNICYTGRVTREECAKYGHVYIDGTHRKSWSYYEYDITVLSSDEVTIECYGMASMLSGGRGELQNTFTVKIPAGSLTDAINERKMQLAEREYEVRLAKAEAELRRREILKVYNELFPEVA